MELQELVCSREEQVVVEAEETYSSPSKDQVPEILKEALGYYLNKHPQLSLHSVSLRSGVSFTTLSRMMKSTSMQAISPHVVLHLSAYLWREYRLEKLVDCVPQALARFIYSHFGKFMMLTH